MVLTDRVTRRLGLKLRIIMLPRERAIGVAERVI